MVETYMIGDGVQMTYDADCVMRLVAEKQARRTVAELTKGEKSDE